MAEPKREELKVEKKRGILVRVLAHAQRGERERALEEIRGLAATAGVRIVDEVVQVRPRPHPATCVGSGKLEEIQHLVEVHEAQLVVFDNNLTPAQSRNLEEALQTIIVDRSEVILDIFATRAQTYEAKLQVELAQLLYFRPRLKKLWTHLERIEGGIGTGRGPGERQIETDRRLIDKRVAELRRRLKTVEGRRRREVARRANHMTVSLVGYTNAGKSTLMRALCGADVLVADKLFATLDTRTRRWEISGWGEVLLSDTVGFVRDLPHHLVASFRSTLEETRNADLLLHVADAGHPRVEEQIATVNKVLGDIGADELEQILVLNKVDTVEDRTDIDILRARTEHCVTVSAATGSGIDRLSVAVSELLGEGEVEAEIETDIGNGRLLAFLNEHGTLTDSEYDEQRMRLVYRIPRRFAEQIGSAGTTVVVRSSS
ncbi:MAG: GTPase HflX [Planctomycetaceae bacterium]|nr:GTPase HflX [Planctomycetaceae bacterium]MDP7275574.1 GTPase HflX [Planctomycetaceae bacterium]